MITNWREAIRYIGGTEELEIKIFDKLAVDVQEAVKNFRKVNAGIPHRPQHAKLLAGITNARFIVAGDLPDELCAGFLSPHASYNSYIRFSNARGNIGKDDASPPDLRGAAIRIFMIDGRTQDLLMTNAEVHHAKDAVDAMAISLAFSKGNKFQGILRLIKNVGFKTAIHMIGKLNRQMKVPVESLSTETFWSRAPLRIGDTVVKYRLLPVVEKNRSAKPEKDLSEELRLRLKNDEVRFSLQVQRYINEDLTPLEDARKPWRSPFETIASLIIPKQELKDTSALFETLSFNPWNVSSVNIEPVGNMNRARKFVYPASVAARATY